MQACVTPGIPGGVAATAGNGQVNITWNAVTSASTYNLYWATTPSQPFASMNKISTIGTAQYTHTSLQNGTAYYYKVTASSGSCESQASMEVNATPAAGAATTGTGAGTGTGTGAGAGTGTGTGAGTGTATATVSGVVDAAALNKPSHWWGGSIFQYSPVAGIIVKAYDKNGSEVGSTTTNANGAYSFSLPLNATYVIRIAYGNVVMKAVAAVGANAMTANVNPHSTAIVVAFARKLGVDNLGESGVSFSTQIASINVDQAITTITTNPNFNALVTNVQTSVTAGTNPFSDSSIATAAYWIVSGSSTAGTTGTGTGASTGTVTSTPPPQTGTGTGTGTMIVCPSGTTGTYPNCAAIACPIGTTGAYPNCVVNVVVPSTPTGVSVTAGNTQVTVNWAAVTGAASYNVYYRTSAGVTIANGAKVAVATSGQSVTGLINGTAYYFVVTAVNTGGESAVSNEVFATPQVPPPSVPTGVWANALNGQVTASWTAVTGATSYNVYYGTTSGVTTASPTKVIGATSGGAITGLTNGTSYYFVVTAVNAGGESTVSSEASAMPGHVVTTLAGSVSNWGSTDGMGTAARFNSPSNITTDGTNLYVADTANNTIRKVVIATGVVTTLAGSAGVSGSTDGTGAAASFRGPIGITNDGTNLYVGDCFSATIRKVVIATGAVTTLAGSAGVQGSIDGTGSAAQFSFPVGITTDGPNLYVSDSSNHIIRKVVIATGVVTTLAGSAGVSGSTDGTGAAARFNGPSGITTDGTNLYVVSSSNSIRKVEIATGVVSTLIGSVGTAGITTDGTNLYITGNRTILQWVIATGVVTTLAGSGVTGSIDGTGTVAQFTYLVSVTTEGTNLYVTDAHAIRKIQ